MSDEIQIYHLVRLGADHRDLLQKGDDEVIVYDLLHGDYSIQMVAPPRKGTICVGTVLEIKQALREAGVKI